MDVIIETFAPVHRVSKRTITKPARAVVDAYKDAYRRVYGVPPEVKFDGTWYRITGHSAGVTAKRLKEMAQQLRYRAGDSE